MALSRFVPDFLSAAAARNAGKILYISNDRKECGWTARMPKSLFEASRLACEEGALNMSLRRTGISDSAIVPFVGIFMWIVVDIVGSVITPGMAKQEEVPARSMNVDQLSRWKKSFLQSYSYLSR